MRHNQAIVITGASTGIGQACALYLDQQGFQVFAGVRKQSDAEALQAQAVNHLTPIFLDVTNSDEIEAAVAMVTETVGPIGLAGLINNAGIVVGGPLEFLPITRLQQQFEINVTGQIAVSQAFMPLLRQARGRIINVGSISGRVAMPFMGPYAASKFALRALTDSLRIELRPWQMHVVLIEPGAIATPIWDKSLFAADQLASELPPRAHELYEQGMERARQRAIQAGQQAIPVEAVVQAVFHALTADNPKSHYLVGRNAKIGALLARLLPDQLWDWLITR